MKISLVTVCFNSESTIEDTLKSVLKQTYDNYEYIIKDGGSTDNTLDIIKKYEKKFKGKLKLILSKDKGIYDAMNIGLKSTKGDIIGLLNSDDVLANKDVFKKITDSFDKEIDGVYSNLYIKDYETMTNVVRCFNAKPGNYKLGWYPPHPTLYLRREIYDKYGYFDISFKIAADYDFMIRIIKNGIKLKYVNDVFVYMRSNGVSTNGFSGYKKSFNDSINVLKKNNIKLPYIVNFIRTIRIFNQSITAKFKRTN